MAGSVDEDLAGVLDGRIQFIRIGRWRYLIVRAPDENGGSLDPAHLLFGQAAQASVAGHLHALNRMRRAQSLDEIALHQLVGDEAVVVV